MAGKSSISRKVFMVINIFFFICIGLLCLLPFVNIFAISLSSSSAAARGSVGLLPLEFSVKSYEYVIQKPDFITALLVSVKRVALGLGIGLFLTIMTAYPLSKEKSNFRFRTFYVWYFVFTILFGGGLIPFYMIVRNLGMINTIWALVIPSSLNVFNAVILLNYFRGLPRELEESAFIDGAGHWTLLWKVYVPLSVPVLATLTLFTVVGHWNSWFDGMIFMTKPSNFPLQTYMQSIIIQPNSKILTKEAALRFRVINERTVKSAQIFIGALPVLMLYPFLQRYFITGLVLGSVKE